MSAPASGSPAASTALPALAGTAVVLHGRAGQLGGYFSAPAGVARDAQLPPLLLVHSVNAAATAAEMRPVWDHARQQRPVLAIDLPGFGSSDRSARAYTPRLMTDAVHDALQWLQQRCGVMSVDMVALSLACEFAARAAVESPASVRRLVLVSPTGFRGSKPRYGPPGAVVGPPWVLKLLYGPGWGPLLFRGLTRPAVVRYFLERTWGSKQIDETLWRQCVHTARQPGAHHAPLHFLSAALFSRDVNTLYENLRQPVWMVHGTRGDFTDYRLKHTVAQRANWQISVYQDCGALMYFEQPQKFGAELDHFLA